MELEKLNVKIFLVEPCPLPLAAFIDVFHGWIQRGSGLYYDIADYSHVKAGPGIVLVAHEANVSIDENGNRRGLLYSRKQPLEDSNPGRLRTVFRQALDYCRQIEADPLMEGKVQFRGEEVLVQVNDRLAAPNTSETLQSLRPDLDEFFSRFYSGSRYTLEQSFRDPRQRFSVVVTAEKTLGVADLCRRVSREGIGASS